MNVRRCFACILFLGVIVFLAPPGVDAQLLPRVSPKASVSQTIGLTTVTLTYSRPGVKGRKIWGGLVPFNKVWRTGANEATTIEFSDDVRINGHPLPAGKYALFTVPGPDTWTVIFNKNPDQWGAFNRDPNLDVLKIQVQPEPGPHREWMMFTFENLRPDAADVVLSWEKLRVRFTVQVDVVQKALANIEKALKDLKPDDWSTLMQAAAFCLDHDVRIEDALNWIDRSISINENYFNTSVKARLLARLGRYSEAVRVGEKAVELGKKDRRVQDTSGLERLIEKWRSQTAK